MRRLVLMMAMACGSDPVDEVLDTGPTVCDQLGLEAVPFDAAGSGSQRRQLARDFTVPVSGADWTLSEQWSGCESYVFITDNVPLANGDTYWEEADVGALIERSPDNAHYFFMVTSGVDDPQSRIDLIAKHVRRALRRLDEGTEPGQQDWWSQRLHVVDAAAADLNGWLPKAVRFDTEEGDPTGPGLAIDRFQRLRGVGSHSDVNRYDAAAANAGAWPYGNSYEMAANEAIYFNFEAERQARLDAEDPTIVSAWTGEILDVEHAETTVVFPTRAELEAFDTVEVDLSAFCPDPNVYEYGNCGAWDYLAGLRLLDEDGETWHEFARFITTYHRAGRYLVDVTPLLALLGDGGERTIRYTFSPPWNIQPTETWLDFRFTNQGKGYRPTDIVPLWRGQAFNSAYNTDRPAVTVDVPADAARVDLWALITGHGGAQSNCAEFCNHQHDFTANGQTTRIEYPEAQEPNTCMDAVAEGVVPNQYGTWWFGRGGWCPGQEVDPTVLDLTDVVANGSLSLSYQGLFNGQTPPDDSGNIELTSYAIIYR